MKEARLRAALVLRETISQERMAALVAARIGRALHQTQWRRYEAGTSEPPLDVLDAAAALSGLSREYLAWGSASEATPQLRVAEPRPPAYPPPDAATLTAQRRGRPATARELGLEEPAESPRKKSGGR